MKKAYFFTMDAFMAIAVMVSGLLLVFMAYSYTPTSSSTFLMAQDVMNLLSNTRLNELNNPVLASMQLAGLVNNTNISIIEQAGLFYFHNDTGNATILLGNITSTLIPFQYSFSLLIENSTVYSRARMGGASDLLLSTRRIIFGSVNATTLWGPYVAEVRVWQ